MITLYHGTNVIFEHIELNLCSPYKDFGQAFYLTEVKNISEQDFRFMTEGITSDLIQMLMDRKHQTLSQAIAAVYNSNVYSALMRPSTGLYAQSSGYIYHYLTKELDIEHTSDKCLAH